MDARGVIERLVENGVPYLVTGSTALSFYAPPRNTADIDLLLGITPPDYEARLRPLFEPDAYLAALVESKPDMMGQLHVGALRFDLIIRPGPWTDARFARGRRFDDPVLGQALVTSPEDLLLAKLESHASMPTGLQWTDAAKLRDHVPDLDWEYIDRWGSILGFADSIRALRTAPPER